MENGLWTCRKVAVACEMVIAEEKDSEELLGSEVVGVVILKEMLPPVNVELKIKFQLKMFLRSKRIAGLTC